MFKFSLSVFDDPDDDPLWDLEDEEAIALLDFDQRLKFEKTSYDATDEFEDNLPVGYQGFTIRDEETGKSWRIKGDSVFKYDLDGVYKTTDKECGLEKALRELAKKRGEMWYCLSEPTKYVAPNED